MGEVWRARDPRLAREVAVKVLPQEFFEGEERRQRFEREAKLLACAEPSERRGHLLIRRNPLFLFFSVAPHPRHGARRGLGPRGAHRLRDSFNRRISFVLPADRRGAGGGAREGDRPSRPEAREREGDA